MSGKRNVIKNNLSTNSVILCGKPNNQYSIFANFLTNVKPILTNNQPIKQKWFNTCINLIHPSIVFHRVVLL